MKKPLDPDSPAKSTKGFSRRGFISGAGVAGGVLGGGVLEEEALAQAPPGAGFTGPGPVPITLDVNGKPFNLTLEPRVTLLDALRNHMNYTGAKKVCDRGTCGACTVLMDGKPVYACTVLAIDAQGKKIETIEGLSTGRALDPVAAAFVNHDAQQCGYCTPGFVMAVKGFLGKHPSPTPEQVDRGLGGNLCRCGTYMGIRKAVLEAAKTTKGGRRG